MRESEESFARPLALAATMSDHVDVVMTVLETRVQVVKTFMTPRIPTVSA